MPHLRRPYRRRTAVQTGLRRLAPARMRHSPGCGIVAEPMGVGLLYAGGPTMVSKQRAQPRRSHPRAAGASLERDKQSASRSLWPLQPQIVVKELVRFRGQRQEPGLVAFAAHADLRFRQQKIVAIQIQDFLRPESL